MKHLKKASTLFLALALTLSLAACGSTTTTGSGNESTGEPQSDGAFQSSILFCGSTSLYPIMSSLASSFTEEYVTWDQVDASFPAENISIYVAPGGSGVGVSAAIDGTADFGMVAREMKDSEVEALGPRDRNDRPIWVAEDSILLTQMIRPSLNKAGYTNLSMFSNGAELWDALKQWDGAEDLFDHVALIITDLEMPQMDGHRLTKLIKSHPGLKAIPVVIFSSLITEEMRRKGKEVGADEQLSKPEIGHLIGIIDELLAKNRQAQKGE